MPSAHVRIGAVALLGPLAVGCSLDPGSGVSTLSGGAGSTPAAPTSDGASSGASTGSGETSGGPAGTGSPSSTSSGDPSTTGDTDVDPPGEGSTGESPEGGSSSGGGAAPGCAATPVEGTGPWLAFGQTAGASFHSGSCGGDSAPEMIHAWTPSFDGTYLIGVEGADFDTVAYVLEGSCYGVELACDNQLGMSDVALLEVTVVAGQTYMVVVDGNPNQSGGYVLFID